MQQAAMRAQQQAVGCSLKSKSVQDSAHRLPAGPCQACSVICITHLS